MLNEGWFPENGALHICAAQEICLIDNHYKPVHQWERDSFDDILEFVAEIMDWQKLRDIPVEDEKGKLTGLATSRMLLHKFSQNGFGKK